MTLQPSYGPWHSFGRSYLILRVSARQHPSILPRNCYAMSGPDLTYAAASSKRCSACKSLLESGTFSSVPSSARTMRELALTSLNFFSLHALFDNCKANGPVSARPGT
eukprot:3940340-Rhodomonas_salina.3